MICCSASSSVTPSRLIGDRPVDWKSRSKMTLMPVDSPMKFRMSRALALLKRTGPSGEVGVEQRLGRHACALLRAAARSAAAAATASMRSRMVRSSSAALAATWRLLASSSAARRYSRSASSSCPAASALRARSAWAAAAAIRRPLERDLVLGAVGIVLHRLPVVLDGRVPVAGARGRLAARERAARRAGGQHAGQQRRPRRVSAVVVAQDSPPSAHQLATAAYCPVSRIVCRPRPSRYAISIDSLPIFRMR